MESEHLSHIDTLIEDGEIVMKTRLQGKKNHEALIGKDAMGVEYIAKKARIERYDYVQMDNYMPWIADVLSYLKTNFINSAEYYVKVIEDYHQSIVKRTRYSGSSAMTILNTLNKLRESVASGLIIPDTKKEVTIEQSNESDSEGSDLDMNYYPQQIQIQQPPPPRILISHSSADKAFCDVFVEMLANIGFTERTIIYTSKPEFAVPLGVDIYEYLRSHLKREMWVFFMLSSNFYSSAACLNEMGAAWIRQNRYFSVLLPGFKHEERKGAINLNQQTLDLCNHVRLTELMNLLRRRWGIQVSDTRWSSIQYDFIEKMKNLYGGINP